MKIVLRITDNGRTAVVRKSTDGIFNVDDVLEAYYKAAKELNLANEPDTEAKVEIEEDSRSDEKWFEDQE